LKKLAFYGIIFIAFASNSCKTAYQNTFFSKIDTANIEKSISKYLSEYKIQNGDEIIVRVYTRSGAVLMEGIQSQITNGQSSQSTSIPTTYVVDPNGSIILPLVGKIHAVGMTENELKSTIEGKLMKTYNEPFVTVKIENRRVIVFKGEVANVITIGKTPVNIFEVIAKSGGMNRFMSSRDIQIVRGTLKSPRVYNVNLSTMEGISKSETMIQPNDIIYIPEKKRELYYFFADLTPIVSLPLTVLTSIATMAILVHQITK
jgi:protein involved in polysaccharide export with SLBB domain